MKKLRDFAYSKKCQNGTCHCRYLIDFGILNPLIVEKNCIDVGKVSWYISYLTVIEFLLKRRNKNRRFYTTSNLTFVFFLKSDKFCVLKTSIIILVNVLPLMTSKLPSYVCWHINKNPNTNQLSLANYPMTQVEYDDWYCVVLSFPSRIPQRPSIRCDITLVDWKSAQHNSLNGQEIIHHCPFKLLATHYEPQCFYKVPSIKQALI